MSEESELIANLERGYSHLGTTVVRDPGTGAMASFTPIRGSKMGKWFFVFMDPVKKEFEHCVCDDHVRTIIEAVYEKHNNWEVVTQNLMPGALRTRLTQEGGRDIYYVDAPGHRQGLPNGYSIVGLKEDAGPWYVKAPGGPVAGSFATPDAAADAAWEDLES